MATKVLGSDAFDRVTLVCAYLACWVATATQGVADIGERTFENMLHVSSPVPFIVAVHGPPIGNANLHIIAAEWPEPRYWFWFFGRFAPLFGGDRIFLRFA